MIRTLAVVLAALGLAVLALAAPAFAQTPKPADDPLSRCFTAHATAADKLTLARWAYAMMSANPKIAPIAPFTQAQRDGYSAAAGRILSRLMVQDCHAEAVGAMRRDGTASLSDAFGALAQASVQDVLLDPSVAAALVGLLGGLDVKGLTALAIEAGVNPLTGVRAK